VTTTFIATLQTNVQLVESTAKVAREGEEKMFKPSHIEFGKSMVKAEDLYDDELVWFSREEGEAYDYGDEKLWQALVLKRQAQRFNLNHRRKIGGPFGTTLLEIDRLIVM
ncbi:hypothetical protein ACJX0J_029959, partial [Zea mays]